MRVSKLCAIPTVACVVLSAIAAGGVSAQTSGVAPVDQQEFASRYAGRRLVDPDDGDYLDILPGNRIRDSLGLVGRYRYQLTEDARTGTVTLIGDSGLQCSVHITFLSTNHGTYTSDDCYDSGLWRLEGAPPPFGFVGRTIPRQSYVLDRRIGRVTLPAATGADGSVEYSVSPELPAGVTFDSSTRVLSGMPRELSAPQTYTYTATAGGESVSLTFTLSVAEQRTVTERERETVTGTVAAVAAATVSNVTANIGSRFAAARSGTGAVVGGVPVSFAQVPEAPCSGYAFHADSRAEPEDATRTLDGAIHTSTFQIALGAARRRRPPGRAPQWTLWGRGDLQFFSSDSGDRAGYDGDLKAGYLGADMRLGDRWLAGAALSRTGAQADYEREDGADDGHLDVSLTSVHPYVRFAPDAGTEVWSVLGAGAGEIEDARDGAAETTDLTMWMGSAGARRALAPAGPAALALLGDAQFVRVETEDGNEAGVIQGLTVDVWRLRAGVEGSYTSALENGAAVTSFVEIAGRYDGGDGGDETGVEVSPGVYYSDPASGFGLEARARALLLHSGEGYEEHGASVTASLAPRAGGEGLSLSLSPRWGIGGGTGAETLWRDTDLGRGVTGPASVRQMSLDARVGYGLGLSRGLLTPFAELGLHETDRRRMRMGVRFSGPGAGALKVELAGEHSEGGASDAVHRVGLTAQLRF